MNHMLQVQKFPNAINPMSNVTVCSASLSDVANVIQACYGETPPPIVLIGHGVGGAIAVHTASNMLIPTTVGLVAIDVVEGEKE